MRLLKKDATEIVNELSTLIDMKLNIVDANGIILANSNPDRVGDFHEAGYKMVQESLDELVVHTDQEYHGTRTGCNLLLSVHGEIVGIVGITGPYEIAKSHGKIIQKMTEILLYSRESESKHMQKQQEREHFFLSWICNTDTVINESFIARGKAIGIDITQKRRVLVVRSHSCSQEVLLGHMREITPLFSLESHVFLTSHSVVLLLSTEADADISHAAQQIQSNLETKGVIAYIGIDAAAEPFLHISTQYTQAKKVTDIGCRLQSATILHYRDYILELTLDDISIESKKQYLETLFTGYSTLDILHDMYYISTLYQENGSIKHAAERLIIHPNTLQYQLKKIESRTGYDPRRLDCAPLFRVAALFLADESRKFSFDA